MAKQDDRTLTSVNHSKLNEADFSKIPSSDEFQQIKVKPKHRWINSIMTLCLASIGICLGVIIGIIIFHFVP